jgi:L-malate glycosyltransferase
MNILWITNIPFGKLMGLAGLSGENTSGSWLNAALNCFIDDRRFDLTVVTVGRVKSIKIYVESNVTYCLLPGGNPSEYNYTEENNMRNWLYIQKKFSPDIIHVWGSEFTHGYLAIKTMNHIPSVIYIQGLLESISRYYLAGMSRSDLFKSITIRDLLKYDWIMQRKKKYYKKSIIEADMIKTSGNVIVENNWCSAHCLNISPKCNIHKSALSIRKEFFDIKWTKEKVQKFTIMSNAAGYPIKGLHVLLKALSIVVAKYPKTKLLIPGENSPFESSFFEKAKENGYTKYIRILIRDLGLISNVCFLGRLSAIEMAKQLAIANVFVLPSSIENHSSTLIEAMIIGVPCISSYVGGIPEYLKHEESGLLYRFEEYEMLARFILLIFSDLDYASILGSNASVSARNARSSLDIKNKLIGIYSNVINSHRTISDERY